MITIYKKGSLNISVEAIIVLILAITMLGLGLGFIKKYFGDISKKVEGYINTQPDPPIPTGSNPIQLSTDFVIVSPSEKTGLKVSVYNPTGDTWNNSSPGISCLISGVNTDLPPEVIPRNIEPGKFQTFIFKFSLPNVLVDEYPCQIRVPPLNPRYFKDLTVSVTE